MAAVADDYEGKKWSGKKKCCGCVTSRNGPLLSPRRNEFRIAMDRELCKEFPANIERSGTLRIRKHEAIPIQGSNSSQTI